MCPFHCKCNFIKLRKNGNNKIEIPLGFEFEESEYMLLTEIRKKIQKEHEPEEHELEEYEEPAKGTEQSSQLGEDSQITREPEQQQVAEQSVQHEIKEDATMLNNIFNTIEFGPNKDENIASTLMGIAVKNGDSWRIYDKKKQIITDIGDMQLGNLPIFMMPTTKLKEGDLIKDDGEYYFVMKVENGSTQTMCAKNGELKTVIPIKNVLGFSCYSKVIAINNSGNFDSKKLVVMSLLGGFTGKNGGQMNQFLPMMLLNDKLDVDDDMLKMMLMSSMTSASAEGGEQNANMNNLLPMMLFKDKLDTDDDMMNMLLMSSMMSAGGPNANNNLLPFMFLNDKDDSDNNMMQMALMSSMSGNNPIMNYMMFDKMMGNKSQQVIEIPSDQNPIVNPDK